MKVLICADMEGISGVLTWDHVSPGHKEYDRFRKIMTAEVNSAIRGAFEAGVEKVVVADGHANGMNIMLEDFDERAVLNSGNSAPYAMVQGIDSSYAGAIFIGYHARAGTQNAILDHTWSSKCVANLWLNEKLVGEIGLNAALCGHYEVPVLMISGDQSACSEAINLLGPIEAVVVKNATSRNSAECYPPKVNQRRIRKSVEKAVRTIDGGNIRPFTLSKPINVRIELINSTMADRAAGLSGATRSNGRIVKFTTNDMLAAYKAFKTAVRLAG